eukprot:g35485.t1
MEEFDQRVCFHAVNFYDSDSLLQFEVPICFKKIAIIPVPKKTHVACFNDCCPVALTSIMMKNFKSHNCMAKFHPNSTYKFADDTIIVGQISNNDETEYRKETECLVAWCKDNHLSLNLNKKKELIIDFRKQGGGQAPLYINGFEVEVVDSIKEQSLRKADKGGEGNVCLVLAEMAADLLDVNAGGMV